ncbi:MAG TPA: hypothetical protein P5033_12030 [Anaerohalosphaeraceae bacterium]|nr:hypothetical protein [Anaerohalosphaeraceae bacterium]
MLLSEKARTCDLSVNRDNVHYLSHIIIGPKRKALALVDGRVETNQPIGTEKGPIMSDTEASVEAGKNLNGVIKIDAAQIHSHLDSMVRSTVEETLNQLLDEEADRGIRITFHDLAGVVVSTIHNISDAP